LKELNNQINIVKSASPAALVKSAPKVIAAAEDAEKQCDEELVMNHKRYNNHVTNSILVTHVE